MAKDKKAKKKKPRSPKKRMILAILVLVALVPIFSSGVLLLCLGMLPAVIASLYVDTSEDGNLSRVVFATNLAGVAPLLLALHKKGISHDSTMAMLGDTNTWLIMWGAAAFGYLLMWFFPQMVHFILEMLQRNRIASFEHKQQQIVDEWGMQVAVTARKTLRNEAFEDARKRKTEVPD